MKKIVTRPEMVKRITNVRSRKLLRKTNHRTYSLIGIYKRSKEEEEENEIIIS